MTESESTSLEVEEREFGKRVRDRRVERGLSQRDLAELLSRSGLQIGASSVTRLERGQRPVRIGEASILADALDIDVEYLLGLDEPTPKRQMDALRSEANTAMHEARRAVMRMLGSFEDVLEFYQEYPDLIPQTTPDQYLGWVEKRIRRAMGSPSDAYAVATDSDRVALQALADALASNAAGVYEPEEPEKADPKKEES